MSIVKFRRRTAVPAIAAVAMAAALLAPAASAVAAGPAKAPAPVAKQSRIIDSVRTEKLIDGSTAKIYKRGAHHYTMKVVSEGYVVATLDANQRDAGFQSGHGMYVVLTADGQVRSWTGGWHFGPGTFKLSDGSTAKVTVGKNRATMEISYRGEVYGTIVAKDHDTGVNANGMYIVLTPDGTFSTWVD